MKRQSVLVLLALFCTLSSVFAAIGDTFRDDDWNYYTITNDTMPPYTCEFSSASPSTFGKTSFTIPEIVSTEIEVGEYEYLQITLNVTSVGYLAFSTGTCENNLKTIFVPGTIKTIQKKAFSNCTNLTSITLNEGVVSIGEAAFDDCSNLKNVYLPNTLEFIGKKAFYGCDNLTTMNIPKSVKSIGVYAFEGTLWYDNLCKNTDAVYINDILYDYFGSASSYKVKEGIKHINQWSFAAVRTLKSITFSNSLKSIGEEAFNGCTELISAKIPDSVEEIERGAFAGCYNLKEINIPNNLKEIKSCTFIQCLYTTKVSIPNSVTIIGDSAFLGCISLKTIVIPSSVQSIGKEAFRTYVGEESSLQEVRCYAIIPPILKSDVFFSEHDWEHRKQPMPLYVPYGSEEDYAKAMQWSNFLIKSQPKTEARLNGITYNDIAIENFDKNTYSYSVVLPWYVDEVPVISATLIDPLSTMQVIPATQLPGDTKIVVTAQEDGKTQRIYTIHFDIQTGIESTQPAAILPTKTIRNGQVVIEKNGKTYDVLGKQIE